MSTARTVLIIDDEQDLVKSLTRVLKLDDYEVESSGSIAETLARSRWDHFDVILLDRKLLDGLAEDLLPRLNELAPQASVVIATGYADLESSIQAMRFGAEDYLVKPVHPDVLRQTLARIMRVKEAEQKVIESERLAMVGQMMAVLAHESGNALARAQSCLEMLSLEVEGMPEAISLIERVGNAHRDLQSLYEEVRAYAAPIKLQLEEWSLDSIWRQAWNNLQSVNQAEEASLVPPKTDLSLVCEVDSFRMQQVFRNLFENAIAACSDSAQIKISISETELHGRPALGIAIKDNGPGLSEEQCQRAFEPFYTSKQKGTGLGLAIVQRIIEAHNGQIEIGSSPEPGATFLITLPRQSRLREQAEAQSQ